MVTRLCDIKPGDTDLTIRARVCRLWRGRLLLNVERNDGMQCLLVDRNNNPIHCIVSEADYDDVKDKIQWGHIYEITGFHATNNPKDFRIVPHESQLLFNNRTRFNPLQEVYPPFPMYWFQFMDFSLLHKRKGNDTILTDVIGRVDSVHEVEDVPLGAKMAPKRSIDIQNLRGENLTVNLWGSMGIEFDVSAIQKAECPVVIVFTSTKVRTYDTEINVSSGMTTCTFINPSIPETEEYRRRFQGPAYAPKILLNEQRRIQRPPLDLKTAEIISIKTLNMRRTIADRDRYIKDKKGQTFLIKGEITKIMCHGDWYYMGCPRCLKQMRVIGSPNILQCVTHEDITAEPMYKVQVRVEDESDSVTLMAIGKGGEYLFGRTCLEIINEEGEVNNGCPPPQLMNMMGEIRVIEVVYGARNDYVIKSVHTEEAVSRAKCLFLKTPEKPASKRALKIQNHSSATQEPTKKQKGPTDVEPHQKMKQVDSLQKEGSSVHCKKALQITDSAISDEDEDLCLSQLFSQQLSTKKNSYSGQAKKALVIGKKTSERLKNKNKSKLE